MEELIDFEVAQDGKHKYVARLKGGKKVFFGALGYEQYKDSTPLRHYSSMDHLDQERRRRYRARHEKIKTKDGRLAYQVKYSPAWFSYHYLW